MKNNNNKKIHYSWIITFGCGLVTFYTVGLSFNCISVYLNPLMDSLGINNTLRSSMTMFYQTGSLLSLPAVGLVIDKIGTRKCILYNSLLMAVGYLMLSVVKSVFLCYVAMLIIGIGYGLCGLVPVSLLLTEWFVEKRGVALGAAMCGSGVATIIAPTIVAKVIATWGINSAFIVQACIISSCAIISFIILRDKPSHMGLLPYGEKLSEEDKLQEEAKSTDEKQSGDAGSVKFKDALRDKRFALMVVVMLLTGTLISPMVQHLSPIISQSGYGEHLAAMAVSMYGMVMLVGKPLFGTVIDKLGTVKANTYSYTFLGFALVSGLFLANHQLLIFAIPLCLGMGSAPMATVALPIWVADLFGKDAMSGIFPMLKICYTLGGLIGASIPGIVMDHTGAYTDLFKLYIVMGAVSYLILQGLFIGKRKQKTD